MTEPDAWMAYNNAGGAGLVPYLLKGRARDNTNLVNGEGPPAYDTDEWPQPLFSSDTIRKEIQKAVENVENSPDYSEHAKTIICKELANLEESFSSTTGDDSE